ncbi:MAG: NDP-sugar synthase, partial [bacterium]|nr:NDP-sugar synthase [bacterium]
DGSDFGVRLHYSHESTILGTAGGIKAVQDFLGGDPFLVINSDVLVDIDLREVYEFHKRNGALLTLVVRKESDPEKLDPIEINDEGRVVHFLGQSIPQATNDTFPVQFTGIQIMDAELFSRIPSSGFCETTKEIFPKMIQEGLPIYAFLHSGYWNDMGRRESYLEIHRDILDGRVQSLLPLKPSIADHPGIVQPVFMGRNCVIGEKARVGPYATLGDNCRIDNGAVVENSVIWDNVSIKQGANVARSVLAERISLGKEVKDKLVTPENQ